MALSSGTRTMKTIQRHQTTMLTTARLPIRALQQSMCEMRRRHQRRMRRTSQKGRLRCTTFNQGIRFALLRWCMASKSVQFVKLIVESLMLASKPRQLALYNDLSPAILTTSPNLLFTRPFLLLPPGAKPSVSATPIRSEAEERRRLLIRQFQMQTKCSEPKVRKQLLQAMLGLC